MDYCDIEWFALEANRDHSVISETASKYCILDSLGDYDGYSIYSKGFLPTVVDMNSVQPKGLPRWFSKESPYKCKETQETWVGKIPWRRKENGNPLQYSC